MKYLIVLTDGAADEPMEALGNKTPLEAAEMPHIDALAKRGRIGTADTVPEGMAPGSDVANLSVMGYDPAVYHTGRSPLEAASIGIDMADTDVAFRCNLVTLQGDGAYEDLTVVDHSAGDISTAEADELIRAINEAFGNERIHFYTGVSYRHAMIIHNGITEYELVPPHDILDRRIGDYLPKGAQAAEIEEMMRKSYEILKNHPVNLKRIEKGLNPANSIWIWGQGKKPSLMSFHDKYGIKGTVISAVDLIKGIAICAGLNTVNVEGATGTLHTNYEGKAKAAMDEFSKGRDFVYMHLEGPDECSHQGDMEGKIKCLESIDEKIVAPMVEYMEKENWDYRILVLPDHPTPLRIRTHTRRPVPFVFFDSTDVQPEDATRAYSEAAAQNGMHFANGYELTDYFFAK